MDSLGLDKPSVLFARNLKLDRYVLEKSGKIQKRRHSQSSQSILKVAVKRARAQSEPNLASTSPSNGSITPNRPDSPPTPPGLDTPARPNTPDTTSRADPPSRPIPALIPMNQTFRQNPAGSNRSNTPTTTPPVRNFQFTVPQIVNQEVPINISPPSSPISIRPNTSRASTPRSRNFNPVANMILNRLNSTSNGTDQASNMLFNDYDPFKRNKNLAFSLTSRRRSTTE